MEKAIQDAYDDVWLRGIRHNVLEFSHLMVNKILDHLESQCLALTAREKAVKLRDIHAQWDKNDEVKTFFDQMEKLAQEIQDNYGI